MIDPISILGSGTLAAANLGIRRPYSPERIETDDRKKLDGLTNTAGSLRENPARFDRIDFNYAKPSQSANLDSKQEFASVKLINKSTDGLQPELAELKQKLQANAEKNNAPTKWSQFNDIKSELNFDLAEGIRVPGFSTDEIEERISLGSGKKAEERFALARETDLNVARTSIPDNETGKPEQENSARFSPFKQKAIEAYMRFAAYQNPIVMSHAGIA